MVEVELKVEDVWTFILIKILTILKCEIKNYII